MPLTFGWRMADWMAFFIAATERPLFKLFGDTLSDQLRVDSGFLTSRMFSLTFLPVSSSSFGQVPVGLVPLLANDDARPCAVWM